MTEKLLFKRKRHYAWIYYLNNVIKDLEQKEHQVMISGRWEKEPRRAKRL